MKNITDFKRDFDFGAASRRGFKACRGCRHWRGLRCRHPELTSPFDVAEYMAPYRGCVRGFEARPIHAHAKGATKK